MLEDRPDGSGVEVLSARDVPLGGPRAMSVRRTLPQRGRSLIGAWCFIDHYGPHDVRGGRGMVVPPHPHTGLQTVSWLFSGEVEHRDSLGSIATVRPGEVNVMTAGSGIQHSEVSTDDTSELHGVQLWVALPDAARHCSPAFEHYAPEAVAWGDVTVRVFLGSLAGQTSPLPTHSPLVGAQLDLPAGDPIAVPLDPAFEYGILVDRGALVVDGTPVPRVDVAYLPVGRDTVTLDADGACRLLLLGGEPLGEQIVMWWNFIGRSHDEIVKFREAWQADVITGLDDGGRFGAVDYDGQPLAAPTMPGVRLRARG
ncbi:pirin family protein [Marisediminicola senii]|nr:pirin family protein [Marisediminicola senii]